MYRFLLLFMFIPFWLIGQTDSLKTKEAVVFKKWYDNFSIRGYAQVRYNRLLETNENLVCEQCDRSWG
ncbi:MAG TPA: hypothetical protein PLY70_17970, partial [Saprospiraceae bacterium]|nr:hypothetical protein [Saprospiraceae bacterium]